MAYASFKEAVEDGAPYRLVLWLSLLDADNQSPTGLDDDIFLTDGDSFVLNSNLDYYVSGRVLDFGVISQVGDYGGGLDTLSDLQITLSNDAISAQRDNSEYTYPSGSGGMDPELTGDEVRLSEYMQTYSFKGAVVTIRAWASPSGNFDDHIEDLETFDVFVGMVRNVTNITHDSLQLDITPRAIGLDDRLPDREITDAVGAGPRSQFAPVVYGNFFPDGESVGLSIGGNEWSYYLGGVRMPMAPAVFFDRTGTDNEDYRLIYNDVSGPNSSDQDDWGISGKSNAGDSALIYHPEINAWTLIDEGTSPGQTSFVDDTTGTGRNEYLALEVSQVQHGRVYIPAIEVADTSSGSYISNQGNLFDNDPTTWATLDLAATGWVDLRITPTAPLGAIIKEADAISGWVLLSANNPSGSPIVWFGIYKKGSSNHYVGGSGGSPAVWGVISGTEFNTDTHRIQRDENAVDIPTSAYSVSDEGEPLLAWRWFFTDNDEEMVMRIQTQTAGTSGDELHVIAAGIEVHYRLSARKSGWVYTGLSGQDPVRTRK